MPQTLTQTVYQFDELSDRAKEKARDWYRSCMDSSDYADHVIEDAAEIGSLLGIEFDTHHVRLMGGNTRAEPSVWWSGFWSQGDGACFDGSYRYVPGSVRAIEGYAPTDKELKRIAEGLRDVQRKHFYSLRAHCKQSGYYYHSHCMRCDVTDSRNEYRDIGSAEKDITQLLRDFADWIYRQLEQSYEWESTDAQVDENILANEYTFYEDGARVLRG